MVVDSLDAVPSAATDVLDVPCSESTVIPRFNLDRMVLREMFPEQVDEAESFLSTWYFELTARQLDLAECGAKESVVVDGDSLLFDCLMHPSKHRLEPDAQCELRPGRWSWLQVFWLIERFLSLVLESDIKFDVVFFAVHAMIWSADVRALTIREALLVHLSTACRGRGFQVRNFATWKSKEWKDYVLSSQPRLFLITDGTAESIEMVVLRSPPPAGVDVPNPIDATPSSPWAFMWKYTRLSYMWKMCILHMLDTDIEIALLSTCHHRDNRLIGLVIDRRVRLDAELRRQIDGRADRLTALYFASAHPSLASRGRDSLYGTSPGVITTRSGSSMGVLPTRLKRVVIAAGLGSSTGSGNSMEVLPTGLESSAGDFTPEVAELLGRGSTGGQATGPGRSPTGVPHTGLEISNGVLATGLSRLLRAAADDVFTVVFVKSVCVYDALLRRLPLQARSHFPVEWRPAPALARALEALYAAVYETIIRLPEDDATYDFPDLFDEKMYLIWLETASSASGSSVSMTERTRKTAQEMWAFVCAEVGLAPAPCDAVSNMDPSELMEGVEVVARKFGPPALPEIRLHAFKNAVMNEIYAGVNFAGEEDEEVAVEEEEGGGGDGSKGGAAESKAFEESYHWHMKSLLEYKAVRVEPEGLKWLNKSKQKYISWMHTYAESLVGVKGLYFQTILGPSSSGRSSKGGVVVKQTQKAKLLRQANIERVSEKQRVEAVRSLREAVQKAKKIFDPRERLEILERFLDSNKAIGGDERSLISCRLLVIETLFEMWSNEKKRDFRTAVKIYENAVRLYKTFEAWLADESFSAALVKIFSTLGLDRCARQIRLLAAADREAPLRIGDTAGAHREGKHASKSTLSKGKNTDSSAESTLSKGKNTESSAEQHTSSSRQFDPILECPFSIEVPKGDSTVGMSDVRFQMLHCGHLLERSTGAREDPRVPFLPDDWQRELLDAVDRNESALVLAPTSAGKTFIAFYAMEKVLKESDDDIVVYVSPTKALVSQTVCEAYARFGTKKYKCGKSVVGTYTRDYQYEPMNCQILVCVPQILEILLLSPIHCKNKAKVKETVMKRSWAQRVRRIIFDEVHLVGEMDGGGVWERLLQLAQCPILALSATVGNPERFHRWMEELQGFHGHRMNLVSTQRRYSDLQKFVYAPELPFRRFTSVHESPAKSDSLVHINPLGSLAVAQVRESGFSADFKLMPLELLQFYDEMCEKAAARGEEGSEMMIRLKEMAPERSLLSFGLLTRDNTDMYENEVLKPAFREWTMSHEYVDSAREVVESIARPAKSRISNVELAQSDQEFEWGWTLRAFPYLLAELCAQKKLPAIVFCLHRGRCMSLALQVAEVLARVEASKRSEDSAYQSKKKDAIRASEAADKNRKKASEEKKKKNRRAGADPEASPPTDDAPRIFDWERHDPDCTFVFPEYRVADKDLQDAGYFDVRQKASESMHRLLDALERGVGVHHAGMPRKYLACVEVLFRRRHLQVVIATGTLALGINMPAKSVVFAGHNVFLSGINYRQMSGRAGRRGFDLVGNVVFFGISWNKIRNLLNAHITPIRGHVRQSTSLVLRSLCLLTQASNAVEGREYGSAAVRSLFRSTSLSAETEFAAEQVLHHLRFSIEYLRRMGLVEADGNLVGYAGLAMHLYYTEPSNFVLVALLRSGLLQSVAGEWETAKNETAEKLMHVLAHLFNRLPLRRIASEYYLEVVRRSSSKVILQPLCPKLRAAIDEHDLQVMRLYSKYVRDYCRRAAAADVLPPECVLPLSGRSFSGTADGEECEVVRRLELAATPGFARSRFSALSGFGDKFDDVYDLSRHLRPGVHIDPYSVPIIGISSDEHETLNAYQLDFYMHGQLVTIETANGVKEGDSFQHLKDMLLIMKAIVTSLQVIGAESDARLLKALEYLATQFEEKFDVYSMKRKRVYKQRLPNVRV